MHLYLAKRNDGGSKVIERHETSFEFFVPNRQLAESVEPAVTDLDSPPSCLPAWITSLGISLCAPADDMGDAAVLFNGAKVGDTTVARASAQLLASSMRRILALDDLCQRADAQHRHVNLNQVGGETASRIQNVDCKTSMVLNCG